MIFQLFGREVVLTPSLDFAAPKAYPPVRRGLFLVSDKAASLCRDFRTTVERMKQQPKYPQLGELDE